MDYINFIWFGSFIMILVSSNILYHFITKYIAGKSPGSQSLYDVILKDHILVVRFSGQFLKQTLTRQVFEKQFLIIDLVFGNSLNYCRFLILIS
jgi:hypothetical protein